MCQNEQCKSKRLMDVVGKAADRQTQQIGLMRNDGEIKVPHVIDHDYLRFTVCLDCGQMQGTWPLALIPELEGDG